MPLFDFEELLVFYNKQPIYHPQFFEGKPLHGMGKKYKEGKLHNNNYGTFSSHKNPSADRVGDTKKYPRTTLFYAKPHPPIHPTQKPTDLCEFILRTYSDEDENTVILDNCTGVGTIPIACVNLNRKFVAFEKDPRFFSIAQQRIGETICSQGKQEPYQNFFL
jgi:site-specific DNA-methyltransferase (adenine-specific)